MEGARLAGVGRSVDPKHMEEFPMLAASPLRGLEVGGDTAAEFARESVAGVVELELRLTGAFKYRSVHAGGSKRLDVTCPLKLQVAGGASAGHARAATLHVHRVRQSHHDVLVRGT